VISEIRFLVPATSVTLNSPVVKSLYAIEKFSFSKTTASTIQNVHV